MRQRPHIPAIRALHDAELAATPCSAVLDTDLAALTPSTGRRRHGVAWRVVEHAGEVAAVVLHKNWGEGIGPQAPGAVTLVAARPARVPPSRRCCCRISTREKRPSCRSRSRRIPPYAAWLHLRGALRKWRPPRSSPAATRRRWRIDDLATVLGAVMRGWDTTYLAERPTPRVGDGCGSVATTTRPSRIDVLGDGIGLRRGAGGVEIGAPPAVRRCRG